MCICLMGWRTLERISGTGPQDLAGAHAPIEKQTFVPEVHHKN